MKWHIDKNKKLVFFPLAGWEKKRGVINLSGPAFSYAMELVGENIKEIRIYEDGKLSPNARLCISKKGRYIQSPYKKAKEIPEGTLIKIKFDIDKKAVYLTEA